MADLQKLIIILLSVLLRWSTSYHPYSGQDKPPMFGDYEAQRHWQEVTLHLKIADWYTNTTDNDLLYWGLDYPPLTAYHSLLLGKAADFLNPSFVELRTSRGFESEDHKLFMRISVLITDLLIYIPAILLYFRQSEAPKRQSKDVQLTDNLVGLTRQHYLILSSLLYPGIILIDHGHFQYNSVSLGFFILAVVGIVRENIALGSICFVLALNYKQMELYHALPIFFYILGTCWRLRRRSLAACLKLFLKTAVVVLVSFFIIWSPFVQSKTLFDVFARLFPVGRGLFEDKVANIWCSINVLVKLKELFSPQELFRYSLMATVASVVAANLDLFVRPSKEKLLLALINTSIGFYLFSFQVHEKTILLVAVPVLLYFHKDPFFCFWFLVISSFSMLPLLIKDGLFIAYCGLMVFYFVAVTATFPGLFETSRYVGKKGGKWLGTFLVVSFSCSVAGSIFLSLLSVLVAPPKRYPDLFPLLISVYSCAHFCAFMVYFNCRQLFWRENLK